MRKYTATSIRNATRGGRLVFTAQYGSLYKKINRVVDTIFPKITSELERYKNTTGTSVINDKYTEADLRMDIVASIEKKLTSGGISFNRAYDRLENFTQRYLKNPKIEMREIVSLFGRKNNLSEVVDEGLPEDQVNSWTNNIWINTQLQTAGGGAYLIKNIVAPYKEYYYTKAGNALIHEFLDAGVKYGKNSNEAKKLGKQLAHKENLFKERQNTLKLARQLRMEQYKKDVLKW